MAMIIVVVLTVLLLCESSYGWGLATHMELAESLLTNAALLTSAAGALILKHRKDFILGNLLADVMVGKKMSKRRKTTHHWIGGLRLLDNAEHNRTRAFAYGFLTHLAADTVAHNQFIPRQILQANSTILLGHLYWEVMADQLTDPARRKSLQKLLNHYSPVHDQQLEEFLYPEMKWFAFNKSIFTQVNRLANDKKFLSAVHFCREFSANPLVIEELAKYKSQASERMLDILKNGTNSSLLKEDPNGCKALANVRNRRLASIILPG